MKDVEYQTLISLETATYFLGCYNMYMYISRILHRSGHFNFHVPQTTTLASEAKG